MLESLEPVFDTAAFLFYLYFLELMKAAKYLSFELRIFVQLVNTKHDAECL